jgi:acetyltransferase-like isoleucine patch superfamily enzyme
MADFFQHETALVAEGARIGKDTRIWAFVNIQEGAQVGEGCNICDSWFVESGAKIGNHVTLKNGVCVFDGIALEDDVFCGANASFINDRYPRSHREDHWILEKTVVRKGATIGSNASILCGIEIGEYAVIGAGSVVTQDVSAHVIVRGNPAAPCGYACHCGRKLDENFRCSCGAAYINHDGRLIKKG